MANCLMLLSRGQPRYNAVVSQRYSPSSSQVFECKTCNRKFSSFQALGGHRANHKKHPMPNESPEEKSLRSRSRLQKQPASTAKAKPHKCSVCGLVFSTGQALGGHMRRHRSSPFGLSLASTTTTTSGGGGGGGGSASSSGSGKSLESQPVAMKKSRVFGMDLNLTPCENVVKMLKHGTDYNPSMVDFFS
ncbi:Zinc finger protein ZAT11 [Linum grandiflorum]